MSGVIALVGSGEYLQVMDDVDRWLRMGVEHFTRLGAEAEPLRIVDRASADVSHWVDRIAGADLIYFSGGNPLYLYRTLAGSRAWAAVQGARARGAAARPTVVVVEDGRVTFHSAGDLWELTVAETVDRLERRFGRDIHTANDPA